MHVLAEFTPLDPVTGLRPVLRVCSAEDRRITALNGTRWWPAMVETPVLTLRLFDGDFSSDVEAGGASLAVLHNRLLKLDPLAGRFAWAGAGVKIWAGNAVDAWPWTQWFEGKVTGFEARGHRLKLQAKVNTEPFEKDALTLTYAGTGGAEGDANLKNKVKPWVFGRALNVEPVLVDATNNVYQFSAYGPIQAVNVLYERASDFGVSAGDYASYAALVAATIPAGRWGTCLAQGLIRLGAPAYGVITGDVDGDKPSGVWIRRTGEIISRIATHAGVSSALLDTASLAALDAAVPYNINLVLDQQTTVLDIARRLARPCNAQAGVSWLGKLFTVRVAIGTPALTLDAQGRQKPGVLRSIETDVSPPYWRLEMGAQRAWRVHTLDEISSYDPLVDRGSYVSSGWYKAGNVVQDQGVNWTYVNATPSTGNAPPTLPTKSNAYWQTDAGAAAITLVSDAEAFTFTDGAADATPTQITFTASRQNSSETVTFSTSPAVTLTGTGLTRTLSQANFGANRQVVVTATGATSGAIATKTVVRLDRSTAAAGATVGRNLILNPGAETGVVTPWVLDQSTGGPFTLVADTTSPVAGKYRFLLSKASTTHGIAAIHPAIQVTPLKKYLVRVLVSGNGGASATGLYIRMNGRSSAPSGGYVTFALVTGTPVDLNNGGLGNGPVTAGYTTLEHIYTVPAGTTFVSPAIYNWQGAPLGLAWDEFEFYELTDYELNADVSRTLTVGTVPTIQYDYTGTSSPQLPMRVDNVMLAGAAIVTAGTTFVFSPSGCTISTAGTPTGSFSLTGVSANSASVAVTATYAGVSRLGTIPITRTLGAAPGGPGGGGSGATSFSVPVSATVTDTSYDGSPQLLFPAVQMQSNASGQMRLVLNGDYQAASGETAQIIAKAQRSTDGVTQTDTGLSATGTTSTGGYHNPPPGQLPDIDNYVEGNVGTITANTLLTGLTPSTNYWIQWIPYKTGTAASVGVSGTASGAQS